MFKFLDESNVKDVFPAGHHAIQFVREWAVAALRSKSKPSMEELTPSQVNLVKRIIQEIELCEGIPVARLSKKKIDYYTLLISNRIQALSRQQLKLENKKGRYLLEKLRSNYSRQKEETIILETKANREYFDPIDTFIFDLKKSIKAKEMVVFCGAGISFNSGLPLANDLVRSALKKLSLSKEKTEIIINSNLPFEAFIETLSEYSKVDRIFDIFDLGKPNTNHFLLAKLAKEKYVQTICTTNFDQLIEKAFESEGLIREDDFQVFYKEDDLDNIDWDDNKVRLIKIHGSVEDKDDMAITLQQVAAEELSAQRMSVIEHVFSKGTHKSVLVLGYSCSDVFDISPQIEAMRKNHKEVIFIDHCKKERAVKNIKDKKKKNPFQHFDGSKWVLYNTDELVKGLWDICEQKDNYMFSEITKGKTLWKRYLDDWFLETEDNYTRGAKYIIVSAIFFSISEYKSAVAYCEQALSIAKEIGDKKGEGISFSHLGSIYYILGNYHKAIEIYEQSLSIAREIGDKKAEGVNLGNLGNAYDNLGDYQKAIEFHEQSLSISRKIGDKKGEGANLGNLGITYDNLGDYQKAIEFYEQALSITREIGDKKGDGTRLGNLGITYYNLEDYEKAIEFHEQALSIAKEIGDKTNEGVNLGNLGIIYDSLGDHQKAIEFHEQSLSIAKEIGDKKAEGAYLGNLGSAYYSLGYYEKAIEFHEQALSIAKEIGDKKAEGTRLGNLGITYYNLGDYEKAIAFYEQALSIAREIGDKTNEGANLGNLGSAYYSLGYYEKAIEFHEQALVILKLMLGNEHPNVKSLEANISMIKSQ